MNELQTLPSTKTMLSTEIAELTGKNHKDVMRDIRTIVEQMQGADLRFVYESTTYKGNNGQSYPCYALDYESTMIVLTGYDVVARAKVIKRWQELEKKESAIKPISQIEALLQTVQLMADIEHRQKETESNVIELQNKVKELEYKTHTSPNEFYTISGYASLRGIKVDVSKAGSLGKQATKLSKEWDYPINKAHSEIFGQVNVYHIDVLNSVFESL